MAPKRVILRLRESHFPNMLYPEIVACVKAYLAFAKRPVEEADKGKHFWLFQPPTGDTPSAKSRFHIAIDIDQSDHSGSLPENFPHEIYRVLKAENKIQIVPFKRIIVRDHVLHELRRYSDDFYLWGRDPAVSHSFIE